MSGRTAILDPVWIPLSDGTRLAATIRLPANADANPVPALLEYLPYRRRDGTLARDAILHQFYAEAGYAAIRLDIRGTGDSDGLLTDEYTVREQLDAVEAIAWIAAQPWCSGKIGMFGISWGGFNALQVAARRPPTLKAIITLCSTDDRWRDECHYMGGALLTNSLGWGMQALQYAAQPPDPAVVGERWRGMWEARLENLELFAAEWLRHQTDDAYWRQGSVADDYGAIDAAVLAVGGWADGYSNAIPRLMEKLSCPRKAWIGPWAHAYPHIASPGPAIDFPRESLRWWDRWLKDLPTGIENDPHYRIFVEDSFRPAAKVESREGQWMALDHWRADETRRLHLTGSGLATVSGPLAAAVSSPLATGGSFGEWCPYSGSDLPGDQRDDDALSAVFDTPPLDAGLLVLGAPVLRLALNCDGPDATLAVRLNEVFADGASANVTYGVLRLHGGGDVVISLNDIAHRFAAGSRIRLAVSTAFWPLLWPGAERATVTLTRGELALPVAGTLAAAPPFAPAPPPRQAEVEMLSASPVLRTVTRSGGESSIDVVRSDSTLRVVATDTIAARRTIEHFGIGADDPLTARLAIDSSWSLSRPGWAVSTDAQLVLTATTEAFHLGAELQARDNGRALPPRRFDVRIPRRSVR